MRLLFIPLLITLSLPALAADKINFSRDIRPIFSENCFACHGPDDKKREAKLRFDDEASAKATRKGVTAVTPGSIEKSAIIERIESKDPDDVMPPPKLHKTVSPAQLALLKAWIKQGAPWGKHWSYEVVTRPKVPEFRISDFGFRIGETINPIDAFLAARLATEHLTFSPEADAPTIVRRLALDLTGLPPTIEDLNTFASDQSAIRNPQSAIEHYLSQPAFGEHFARGWLDLARYADSSGYPSDQPREIWAYRDWVIRALNANMPFDQFTIEQLAGDLLPNPTQDQLIATAFHRNTMTQNEGGTNDEEFRNAAIIDRVNTTMAVWMGTSMACAQCHTHKYDPITNKEYFQFYAILNQSADADKKDEAPFMEITTAETKQKRDALQSQLAAIETRLAKPDPKWLAGLDTWAADFTKATAWQQAKPLTAKATSGQASTIRDDGTISFPAPAATDTHTLELPLTSDKLSALRLETFPAPGFGNFVVTSVQAELIPPTNAPATNARFVRVELPGKGKILHLAEVQVMSKGTNLALKGKATQSSQYLDADAKRAIDGNTNGDYAKASVSHCAEQDNPWWEVDLGSAQPIEHIILWNRTDGDVGSRLDGFRVLALDDKRQQVWQSEPQPGPKMQKDFALGGPSSIAFATATADYEQAGFTAASVLLPKDAKNQGWAIAGATDKPHSLTLLTATPAAVAAGSKLRVTIAQTSTFPQHTLGSYRLSTSADARIGTLAKLPAPLVAALSQAKDKRTPEQQAGIADHYIRNVAKESAPDRTQLTALKKQLDALKPDTVPIMKDLTGKDRRLTRIQLRGNWQALDEEVHEGTPAAFPPLPEGIPPNRLALAKWLVSRQNPLTARVMMNRLWEHLFGVGIVRTSEEFGSQGELPTHPDLLDWLAAEFMDSGWDVKHMLTLMVSSRAYRQSSKVAPDMQERDPDNRLLARGPRFRPSGELIRDQALAVSGLLSPKMYGPGVRPLSPALGLSTAFGRGNDWTTSTGEDAHRRSVYTEVRRNAPYASFMTFDATNRETCTIRRSRTNTPLQAFVTLNDPVFIECAQALARRILKEAPSTTPERLAWTYRLTLARAPTATELHRLTQLVNDTQATYTADPAHAQKMATDPLGPVPEGLNVTDLATWSTVANVVLNLDEFVMRR